MARTMLNDSKMKEIFLVQEVHTTVHIQNCRMIRNNSDKNPYKLWKGIPANVKHFKVFEKKCYIKREVGRIRKFDSLVHEGILVGYSRKIKAYTCFNIRLNIIVEIINLTIDEIGGQVIKEGRKYSVEQAHTEDLK
jgi:hypothetical protein